LFFIKIIKYIFRFIWLVFTWQPKPLIRLEIGAIEKMLTEEIICMIENKEKRIDPKTKDFLYLEIIKRLKAKTGV